MSKGIFSAIGHTPLVNLEQLYPDTFGSIHAKLEMFNPGGSIKDRPAWLIISKAVDEGKINRHSTIIESSSGNMAIGLAQVCRYLDLSLIVVVDPKINRHTRMILQAYDVQVDMVTEPDSDGNYLAARLNRVQELLDKLPDSYWPNQYANRHNTAAQYQTMKEIVAARPEEPDYLFAATSTCGTVMGCAQYVKKHNLKTKIVAVDAVGSVIFGTAAADRLVPGHGAGRASELLEKDAVDHVVHISDKECIIGCRRLLEREAILAGGSSGAIVMAVEKLQSKIPHGSTCALILADSGERYLDTLFNDEWVEKHFGKDFCKRIDKASPSLPVSVSSLTNSPKRNREDNLSISESLSSRINSKNPPAPPSLNGINSRKKVHKLAIIGGGPKGTYGFERLAAQFKVEPPAYKVEIHVYNKSPHFGAGDIYRPGQPSYLLMNNPAGDITMWIDEKPRAVVDEPLSFTDWLRGEAEKDVTKNDCVGRNLTGRYLMDGFERIASNLPAGVCGKFMIGEVTDICQTGNQYTIQLKTAPGETISPSHRYDHILLATGHPRNQPGQQDKEYRQFSDRHSETGFIPFIYPVERELKEIAPGSSVAVKGLGLTFVDAVLALTQGRGGTFIREAESGRLLYHRSGNEPEVIFPYSRSGLPMIPRDLSQRDETPLKFFTRSALDALQQHHPGEKMDFKKQIWPLLKQEMLYTFYNKKFEQSGYDYDLSECADFDEVQHPINSYHKQYPDAERFDPDFFLKPAKNKDDGAAGDWNQFIRSYLEFYLKEAEAGERCSPWAAVSAVWRKATPLFAERYAFGGLTPASQRYFDTKFRRLLNRVTFGPPAESTEKLIALMEAGILNFNMARSPIVHTDEDERAFLLKSPGNERQQKVAFLVNARISKTAIADDQSPLYRNLLHRGLITRYKNETADDSYIPGCVAISPDGYAIDSEGNINRDIAVTGTPTEGTTFDNDALSRTRNNFISEWAAFIRSEYAQSAIVQK